jgi:hypothetical protein
MVSINPTTKFSGTLLAGVLLFLFLQFLADAGSSQVVVLVRQYCPSPGECLLKIATTWPFVPSLRISATKI